VGATLRCRGLRGSKLASKVLMRRVNLMARISHARAREGAALMMALAARRELGGGVRQHPGSTTALRAHGRVLALRFRAGAMAVFIPWRAIR